MSEYEFPENSDITITVNRNNSDASSDRSNRKRKRGVISVRRSETPMHRRKSNKNAIRFFDGSYLKEVGGEAYELAVQPVASAVVTMADYEELYNIILTRGVDKAYNLDQTLSRLQSFFDVNEYIPLDLYLDLDDKQYSLSDGLRPQSDPSYSSKWKTSGLYISQQEINNSEFLYVGIEDRLNFTGGASSFQLKGDDKNKITSLPSYDAPLVTFNPSSKMDITLIPYLSLHYAQSITIFLDGVNSPVPNIVTIPLKKVLIPREYFYLTESSYFGKALGGNWHDSSQPTISLYNRAYDAATISIDGYDVSNVLNNLGLFPAPPDYPYFIGYPYAAALVVGYDLAIHSEIYPHRLLAVIKQNSNTFYVWSD